MPGYPTFIVFELSAPLHVSSRPNHLLYKDIAFAGPDLPFQTSKGWITTEELLLESIGADELLLAMEVSSPTQHPLQKQFLHNPG